MENPFELIMEKLNKIETLLNNLRGDEKHASIVNTPNEILNADEAASYLSITKSTLYKHTADRKIPHYKNGKKLYFKRTELGERLTSNRIGLPLWLMKMMAIYTIGQS